MLEKQLLEREMKVLEKYDISYDIVKKRRKELEKIEGKSNYLVELTKINEDMVEDQGQGIEHLTRNLEKTNTHVQQADKVVEDYVKHNKRDNTRLCYHIFLLIGILIFLAIIVRLSS